MKYTLTGLIFFFAAFSSKAQTTYNGTIDKYPVELVTTIYGDGLANAMYVYTKFDDPISLSGTLKDGTLTLTEKDSANKNRATLLFTNFDGKSATISGTWKDKKTNKALAITLTKGFSLDDDAAQWNNKELLQAGAMKDKYFKVVLSKGESANARVKAVKIYEKKTDRLLQKIDVDCQLMDFNCISVDDYNFDGSTDFSLFESSYAGPNTSSLYFLFDPKTKKYVKSSYEGTSLEFDQKTKRIHEHNQCCAGTSYQDSEYKVVNNKMVLIKSACFQFNEKTNKYKQIKCS